MGVLEETKSSGRGNFTGRIRVDPNRLPQQYPPPELGRPSLSESTGAKSKQFSPQFDKISSHTKNKKPMGDGENLLDDEESVCGAFIGSNTYNYHGKGSSQPISVDGIFQMSNREFDH